MFHSFRSVYILPRRCSTYVNGGATACACFQKTNAQLATRSLQLGVCSKRQRVVFLAIARLRLIGCVRVADGWTITTESDRQCRRAERNTDHVSSSGKARLCICVCCLWVRRGCEITRSCVMRSELMLCVAYMWAWALTRLRSRKLPGSSRVIADDVAFTRALAKSIAYSWVSWHGSFL